MIFYGWNYKLKKFFGTKSERCPVCKNDKVTYLRTIHWFHFCFIIWIPYSVKYFKYCPICDKGIRMKKAEFFAELKKPDEPLPALSIQEPSFETREITVVREKQFGNTVKVNYFIDSNVVATAKNGETVKFTTDVNERSLFAKIIGGDNIRSNIIILKPGNKDRFFKVKIKMFSVELTEETTNETNYLGDI